MKRSLAPIGRAIARVALVAFGNRVAFADTLYWAGDPFVNGGSDLNNDTQQTSSFRTYDDFVVPASGWNVNEIWQWGGYGSSAGGTVAIDVTWQIRQNVTVTNSRVDYGTVVAGGSASVLATSLGDLGGGGYFETRVTGLNLDLPPGTYLISIWPKFQNSSTRSVNPLRPGGIGESGPSPTVSVLEHNTLNPPFAITSSFPTSNGVGGTSIGQSATVAGTVVLQDLSVDAAGHAVDISLSQGGSVVETHTVTLGSGGSYSFQTSQNGSFDIGCKGRHWLRKVHAGMTVASGSTTTADFNLTNADIDGDNAVTVLDYAILSEYFDKTSADSDWLTVGANGIAPADADIDEDGTVSVFDYTVLSSDFDAVGD